MTVSSELKRQHYTINSGVRTLAIPFPFIDGTTDIRVIVRQAAGTETELVYGTDFTVSGGNVVVDAGFSPWVTNDTVAIFLDPPLLQDVSLPNAGAFQSESVETALDKLVNLAKRTRDLADRSISLTDGSYVGVAGNYDADGLRISNVAAPAADNDATTRASVAAQLATAIITPSVTVTPQAATVLDDTSYDAMLTTLGVGTKGLAIFKDNSNADVLTELGVSAFMQSRLVDADAPTARTNYQVPKWDELPLPNLLVNGDFQVWQLGTTFNSTTPVAGGNNDNVYTADQWILLSNGAAVVDLAKYAIPPVGSRGAMFSLQNTADTKWGLFQIVESQKSIPLRSNVVSFSLDMQAVSSLTGFKFYILAWAGTADSPTRDPISAWGAAQADPTLVANWSIAGSGVVTATSTFATYALENVTIPAGTNNIGVLFTTWDTSFAGGAIARFSAANLVEGARAQKFRSRPLAQEIVECERFYQKTFPLETYPTTNAGLPGALQAVLHSRGTGNPRCEVMWQFRNRMRTVPTTVTAYNPHAANNLWGDGGGNTLTVTASGTGDTGVMFESSDATPTQVGRFAIHAHADARF